MNRGQHVTGPGSITGLYVGERNGVDWIAWEPGSYAPMCAAFDGAEMQCADLDAPEIHTLPAESFARAVRHAVERGEKVLASFGRIAPHSRRRVGGGR
jgi:hypothetical protein